MARLTFDNVAIDDLAARLQKLEDGIDGPIAAACVEAGASTLADRLRQASPVRTGRLRDSVAISKPAKLDGGSVCYVNWNGTHHKTRGHVTRNAEVAFIHNYGRRAGSSSRRGRRAAMTGQQASGWVTGTADRSKDDVYNAMEEKFNAMTREVVK